MKLNIAPVKSIVYPVRFSPETYAEIKKIAKENKTSPSKVIRAFVEEKLSPKPL